VRPGSTPHPVRYSIQLGPPFAVPVKFCTIWFDRRVSGVYAKSPGR
jgi:hypothetical protein